MPEPRSPLSDAEIARELAAIQVRLAALVTDPSGVELSAIREHLRELAEANAQIKRQLGEAFGPASRGDPPDDAEAS